MNQNNFLNNYASIYESFEDTNTMINLYTDVSGNIDKFNEHKKNLLNDPKFLYKSTDNYFDENGLPNAKKNLADGLEEDSQIMLLQQNSVYAVGLIGTFSLIIAAIFIASRN